MRISRIFRTRINKRVKIKICPSSTSEMTFRVRSRHEWEVGGGRGREEHLTRVCFKPKRARGRDVSLILYTACIKRLCERQADEAKGIKCRIHRARNSESVNLPDEIYFSDTCIPFACSPFLFTACHLRMGKMRQSVYAFRVTV